MEDVFRPTVRSRVEKAINQIKTNGWIINLEKYPNADEKIEALAKYMPEIRSWFPPIRQQLFYELNRRGIINLGVCEFLKVDSHGQFCTYPFPPSQWPSNQEKITCLCRIPQKECIIRDGKT